VADVVDRADAMTAEVATRTVFEDDAVDGCTDEAAVADGDAVELFAVNGCAVSGGLLDPGHRFVLGPCWWTVPSFMWS